MWAPYDAFQKAIPQQGVEPLLRRVERSHHPFGPILRRMVHRRGCAKLFENGQPRPCRAGRLGVEYWVRTGEGVQGGYMRASAAGRSLQIRRRATSPRRPHRSNKRRSAPMPWAAGQHGLRRGTTTRRRALKIVNTRPRGIDTPECFTGIHLSKPRPRPEAFLRPRAPRGLTWKETIV